MSIYFILSWLCSQQRLPHYLTTEDNVAQDKTPIPSNSFAVSTPIYTGYVALVLQSLGLIISAEPEEMRAG